MKTVRLASPVTLTSAELSSIKTALKLSDSDQISQSIDPSLIAGLVVEVNSTVVDLTVKRQLTEIAGGN